MRLKWVFILMLLLCGCSKKIYEPKQIEYIEKVIEKEIVIKDTVSVPLPVEVIKEVVPQMDTSVVETSLAKATAYVDTTTKTINHKIENKRDSIKTEIIYKDKIVERIVEKEIPVHVEVIKYKRDKIYWIAIGISLLWVVSILRKIGIIKL